VTASFSPISTARTSKMTLTADDSSKLATSTITIAGTSGGISHTATAALTVGAIKQGTVVDLSSAYNATGIHTDGAQFAATASADGEGFAYSKEALGASPLWDGVEFNLGPANAPDAVTSKTVTLPQGKFGTLNLLATGVEGGQESQVFTITYADGTSSSVTQSLSDWYEPSGDKGESEAIVTPYRLAGDGSKDNRSFYLYGYSFSLDSNKVVRSITLPDNEHVVIFAITLVPPTAP
jgi:alpha-mannosidase